MNASADTRIIFDIYQELGECYTRVGRLEEAREQYRRAQEIDPHREGPYLGLGTLVLLQGEAEAAAGYFSRALEVNPRSSDARCGLGRSCSSQGKRQEGFEHFLQALDLDPDNSAALQGLADCAATPAQWRQAEALLRDHLQRHLVDIPAWYCLAQACVSLGKDAEAEEALKRILLFVPDHEQARALLEEIAAGEDAFPGGEFSPLSQDSPASQSAA